MDNNQFEQPTESDEEPIAFVVDHCERWRNYRDDNFQDSWPEYERIFRGEFSEADRTRGSERSQVITPGTQQAVD